MTIPASYPLDLYRGDTFALELRLWADAGMTVPADLTGMTPTSQVRTDAGALILAAACVVTGPGTISLRIEAASWATALDVTAGRWDLQLKSTAETRTVLAGPVRIISDVTVA